MEELRKIALIFTGTIATIATIGCVLLALNLTFMEMPKAPALSTSTTSSEQESKAKEISNYKDLVSSLQGQRTTILDFAVIRCLLPLFNSLITAVLGYVFAKTALQAYDAYLSKKHG